MPCLVANNAEAVLLTQMLTRWCARLIQSKPPNGRTITGSYRKIRNGGKRTESYTSNSDTLAAGQFEARLPFLGQAGPGPWLGGAYIVSGES